MSAETTSGKAVRFNALLGARRTHQPKGGMCMSCARSTDDCSALLFEGMQVLDVVSGISIVRCSEYRKFVPPNAHWADSQPAKDSALNPASDVATGLAADQPSVIRTKK